MTKGYKEFNEMTKGYKELNEKGDKANCLWLFRDKS